MLMRQLEAELAVRKDLKAVRQLLLHLETAEIGARIAERPSDRAAGRMAIRRTAPVHRARRVHSGTRIATTPHRPTGSAHTPAWRQRTFIHEPH